MAQNERGMGGGAGGNQADRNPARNLTHEDRVRGGRHSAAQQTRDAHGQFAGRRAGGEARAAESGRNEQRTEAREGT